MSEVNEHHVFFAVGGFGDDHAGVTRIMGIEPTAAWAKGDPFPNRPTARRVAAAWHLQSGLPLTEPVSSHLQDLLPRLEQRAAAVREVRQRYWAGIVVAAYLYTVNPVMTLPPELVRRMADLDLGLEFDVYCLAEES